MKAPKQILTALKKEDNFLIATHINPDGDAIGSALALSLALDTIGKKTSLYCRDTVPGNYRFLPEHKKFTTHLARLIKNEPVLVLLDCNSPERAGLEGYKFRSSLVIDHHETEGGFGDIKWIDPKAAATGVMVFLIIKALRIKFTAHMATNLYTAISVDTGTFRYSNTSSDVLRKSAELIEAGAEPNSIADHLYETWDKKRFELLVATLDTLEIKNNIAITYITKNMFKETGTNAVDTENFSNFPRMISSVRISALLRELSDGEWKVSLRSKGKVNVAEIAEMFGGGGHKNAAGFKIGADLEYAKKALLNASRKIR